MNFTQIHPGQGLSLPQLVFALNEELKRTAYSPSYVAKHHRCLGERYADFCISLTFDQVSRLGQDTSTALAMIREWRNSFIPINRVPLDILSLVPTRLSSQKDRLRASFVCRHWRRIFLQRAELWSQLYLSKGEVYVKTFLERVKGSALDVNIGYRVPVNAIALLSPHTKQFRCLRFTRNQSKDIQRFSDINSGPLPLLHTLEIIVTRVGTPRSFGTTRHSSPLLFGNAPNVKVFRFHSSFATSPSFHRFVFPNLVFFDFSATLLYPFSALELLNFLEASPMLQTVQIKIATKKLLGVSQDRVVVLPNVETLTLIVTDRGPGYRIAAHISCPSARFTSLRHKQDADGVIPQGIFPSSVLWNSIVHQYTKNPVEEVTLEMGTTFITACKLTFRSADATVIELCFKVAVDDEDEDDGGMTSMEMYHEVFTQAIRTIRDHPQLARVKRLRICHGYCAIDTPKVLRIANEVGRLFESVRLLDRLAICHCDLRPYLYTFLGLSEYHTEEPISFPQTKEFTISHPLRLSGNLCETGVVGLARSQHTLRIPFERVTIRGSAIFAEAKEKLRPWVGSAESCYVGARGIDDDWIRDRVRW
jgi:hypothetical protein